MKPTMKVRINEEEQTLDTKELTILCHQEGIEITPLEDDVMVIDPMATVKAADELPDDVWTELRTIPNFVNAFKKVFTTMELPDKLAGQPLGTRHVVGLILLIAKASMEGKRPFVKLPESYLHPSSQVGLGDLFITMTGGKEENVPS